MLAAFVYGIWFFLAIEGVPLAAEETRDPKKRHAQGLIAGMADPARVRRADAHARRRAARGAETIQDSDNPLPAAIDAAKGDGTSSATSSTTSAWRA